MNKKIQKKYAVTIIPNSYKRNVKKEKELQIKLMDLLKEYKDTPMVFCVNVELHFNQDDCLYLPDKKARFIFFQNNFISPINK